MTPRVLPVVLAGGAGTRFWPVSRRARPKPFVPLLGDRTLLDATLERLSDLADAEDICVLCPAPLARLTRKALRDWPGVHVLVEPEGRDTAPAIALAAAWAQARDPDAVVGIFPADHHIPSTAAFVRAITAAARLSADGQELILIGIEPKHPDTAYGYIELERDTQRAARGAARVKCFVEKPDAARAKRYASSGDHLWNAGMVVARPHRILDETREHAPEVWRGLGPTLTRMARGRRVPRAALARAYRRAKATSFDYAVLERSSRVRALRGRFRWSDVGSWDALAELMPGRAGNRSTALDRTLALQSSGNVAWTDASKQLVLLGVNDLVVVDTPDALLICAKERAQEVRSVVDELARRGRRDLA